MPEIAPAAPRPPPARAAHAAPLLGPTPAPWPPAPVPPRSPPSCPALGPGLPPPVPGPPRCPRPGPPAARRGPRWRPPRGLTVRRPTGAAGAAPVVVPGAMAGRPRPSPAPPPPAACASAAPGPARPTQGRDSPTSGTLLGRPRRGQLLWTTQHSGWPSTSTSAGRPRSRQVAGSAGTPASRDGSLSVTDRPNDGTPRAKAWGCLPARQREGLTSAHAGDLDDDQRGRTRCGGGRRGELCGGHDGARPSERSRDAPSA